MYVFLKLTAIHVFHDGVHRVSKLVKDEVLDFKDVWMFKFLLQLVLRSGCLQLLFVIGPHLLDRPNIS